MQRPWPQSVNPAAGEKSSVAPVDADVLKFAGELLYGEKWHRPLAEALGRWRQKPVLVQMLYQWDSRKKPVPSWVNAAIVYILEEGKEDLRSRADIIQELATRIWVIAQAQAIRGTLDFNQSERQ